MRVRVLLCALMAVATFGPGGAWADNRYGDEAGPDEVIAAILDTGLLSTHEEFDYRGPASRDDQILAWWDFTNQETQPALPAQGQLWDHRVPDPFDDQGHGTATASLLAGLNRVPPELKSPSFAPGAKLAVARVCDAEGCSGSLEAAIRWAVDTVHADVISMSIGAIVPLPGALGGVNEAADYARRAGTLMVVSNGNGVAGLGLVPDPGFTHHNSDSPYVLSVGSSDSRTTSTYPGFTTDPDVAARALRVPVASVDCDTCYRTASGTSFAAPLVAGMAVSALQTASAADRTIEADVLEKLIKYCARDTLAPPTFEGYGVLDGDQIGCVRTHAAAGTLPARPDPDLNTTHGEEVMQPLRRTWSDTLDRGLMTFQPLPIPGPTNGAGKGGFGVLAGAVEGDRFTIPLSRGEALSAGFNFGPSDGGFEVLVFRGTGPVFAGMDLVARSGWVFAESGGVRLRAPEAGVHTMLVVPWSQLLPEQFGVVDYVLEVTSSDPATPGETYSGESYYAATTTYLG